ncbi:hypothetical protein O9G_001640, partial [Rozella allomycis CSF55]
RIHLGNARRSIQGTREDNYSNIGAEIELTEKIIQTYHLGHLDLLDNMVFQFNHPWLLKSEMAKKKKNTGQRSKSKKDPLDKEFELDVTLTRLKAEHSQISRKFFGKRNNELDQYNKHLRSKFKEAQKMYFSETSYLMDDMDVFKYKSKKTILENRVEHESAPEIPSEWMNHVQSNDSYFKFLSYFAKSTSLDKSTNPIRTINGLNKHLSSFINILEDLPFGPVEEFKKEVDNINQRNELECKSMLKKIKDSNDIYKELQEKDVLSSKHDDEIRFLKKTNHRIESIEMQRHKHTVDRLKYNTQNNIKDIQKEAYEKPFKQRLHWKHKFKKTLKVFDLADCRIELLSNLQTIENEYR